MSCYTCPFRPNFVARLEAERDQQYAEADALYEVSKIVRQSEAEALMAQQPDDSEYMDDTDTVVLRIQARRLAINESIDRAHYLTARSRVINNFIDHPERAQLEAEDAMCNGPKMQRAPRFIGEKVLRCALEQRRERAKVLGWISADE